MDKIKAINCSVFYIRNKKQLVEYNLLNGHRQILYNTKNNILDYYISKNDKIIILNDGYRVLANWNGGLRTFDIWYGFKGFIKIGNQVNLALQGFDRLSICDFDGRNKRLDHYDNNVDISHNGKEIIFANITCVFKKVSTSDIPFDCYNLTVLDHRQYIGSYPCGWVKGSNRVIQYYSSVKGNIITNVESLKSYNLSYVYPLMEINNNMIIQVASYGILVIDINTMELIGLVPHVLNFICYSERLNLLITDTWDYYRLQSKHSQQLQLQRIIIRKNYIDDQNNLPNDLQNLMDMVCYGDLLFSMLPNDILYYELYKGILQIQY